VHNNPTDKLSSKTIQVS